MPLSWADLISRWPNDPSTRDMPFCCSARSGLSSQGQSTTTRTSHHEGRIHPSIRPRPVYCIVAEQSLGKQYNGTGRRKTRLDQTLDPSADPSEMLRCLCCVLRPEIPSHAQRMGATALWINGAAVEGRPEWRRARLKPQSTTYSSFHTEEDLRTT